MGEAVKGFLVAAQLYFGRKDGQSLKEFADEARMLTPEDKAELAPLLGQELGCQVTP